MWGVNERARWVKKEALESGGEGVGGISFWEQDILYH